MGSINHKKHGSIVYVGSCRISTINRLDHTIMSSVLIYHTLPKDPDVYGPPRRGIRERSCYQQH